MEGSIRVFVRPRPLHGHEVALDGGPRPGVLPGNTWSVRGQDTLCDETDMAAGTPTARAFTYDGVVPMEATNTDVYRVVHPLVERVLQGYNASFIAYGQTGSGKTHSILGSPSDPGVLPRSVKAAWELMGEQSAGSGATFKASVTYLEVYNEEIQDLLSGKEGGGGEGSKPKAKQNLKILGDDPVKGAVVEGLSDIPVNSSEEALQLVAQGEADRHYGSTGVHSGSSRSHTLFRLTIESCVPIAGGGKESRRSCLDVVDLAGSERAETAGTAGERLKEGSYINKSLSTLALVISKLVGGGGGGGGGSVKGGEEGGGAVPPPSLLPSQQSLPAATPSRKLQPTHSAASITASSSARPNSSRGSISVGITSTPSARSTSAFPLFAEQQGLSSTGFGSPTPSTFTSNLTLAHVPYRNSKLTRLLRQSLGGTSLTCILATITPTPASHSETLSTLSFATNCKRLKVRPVQHITLDGATLLKAARVRIEELKEQVQVAEAAAVEAEARAHGAMVLLAGQAQARQQQQREEEEEEGGGGGGHLEEGYDEDDGEEGWEEEGGKGEGNFSGGGGGATTTTSQWRKGTSRSTVSQLLQGTVPPPPPISAPPLNLPPMPSLAAALMFTKPTAASTFTALGKQQQRPSTAPIALSEFGLGFSPAPQVTAQQSSLAVPAAVALDVDVGGAPLLTLTPHLPSNQTPTTTTTTTTTTAVTASSPPSSSSVSNHLNFSPNGIPSATVARSVGGGYATYPALSSPTTTTTSPGTQPSSSSSSPSVSVASPPGVLSRLRAIREALEDRSAFSPGEEGNEGSASGGGDGDGDGDGGGDGDEIGSVPPPPRNHHSTSQGEVKSPGGESMMSSNSSSTEDESVSTGFTYGSGGAVGGGGGGGGGGEGGGGAADAAAAGTTHSSYRANLAWDAAGYRAALASAAREAEECRRSAAESRAQAETALAQLSATAAFHARERSRMEGEVRALERELGRVRDERRVEGERCEALKEQLRGAQGEIGMVLLVVSQVKREAEAGSAAAAAALAAAEQRAEAALFDAREAVAGAEASRLTMVERERVCTQAEEALRVREESLSARESKKVRDLESLAAREAALAALSEDVAARERAVGIAWKTLVDASGGGAGALPSQGGGGAILSGPGGAAVSAATLALEAVQRREIALGKRSAKLEEAAAMVAQGDKAVGEREAALAAREGALAAREAAVLSSGSASGMAQAAQLAATLLALREAGLVSQSQILLASQGALRRHH